MIGYMCKYAPIEVLESFGEELVMIEPHVTNFNQSDIMMHQNVCSFAKSVLEDVMEKDYDGVLLTTCCDSVRRLYDVLKSNFPDKFIYIIDVPRKVNDFSCEIYKERIEELIEEYKKFSGKSFNEGEFERIVKAKSEAAKIEERAHKEEALKNSDGRVYKIGISGARMNKETLNFLEDKGVNVVFNVTCNNLFRDFYEEKIILGDSTKTPDKLQEALLKYSGKILNQIPCMRMVDAVNRNNYIENFMDEVDGIIYHTVKFCDNYSFDFARFKKFFNKPLLHIETDTTLGSAGQIRTRVEAFLESLDGSKGNELIKEKIKNKKKKGEKMYILGIDSGSTSTNAVILNDDKKIVAFYVLRTGAKSIESAEKAKDEVIKKAGLKAEDIDLIVATGYGRVSIPFADHNVTEISCHGRGAHFFNPEIRTILDIGGQDSKAIRLNEKGDVIDFAMNDKCAAGTGRFLEMMARTLELSLDDLGPTSKNWKEDIEISNMCTVFAESEVISLIAQNKEKSDICHGLHKSIATKAFSLLKRVGLNPGFMMTGGVAKNSGVVREVENLIDAPLYICEEPEIVGAVGAAVYGLDSVK